MEIWLFARFSSRECEVQGEERGRTEQRVTPCQFLDHNMQDSLEKKRQWFTLRTGDQKTTNFFGQGVQIVIQKWCLTHSASRV